MQGYDATLKSLLRSRIGVLLEVLGAGTTVTEWLNVELPDVQTRVLDLLGRMTSGRLLHLELQSSNDPNMALRMAEYALAIYRYHHEWPLQVVLYIGDSPMRMNLQLEGPDFDFRYRLVDFRELDGETLLASPHIEDNVLAVLARLENQDAAVRRILAGIAKLDDTARRRAFTQLLILSGLRRLDTTIQEEARKMPILNDLLTHGVIGPAILQGREEGLKEGRQVGRLEGRQEGRLEGHQEGRLEGRQEGRLEGHQEGRQEVLRTLLTKRFGTLPAWVETRLPTLTSTELDDVALRLLDARSLEALFSTRD